MLLGRRVGWWRQEGPLNKLSFVGISYQLVCMPAEIDILD